jgi:hypothetical protein
MRNRPFSETELMGSLEDQLRSRLPSSWMIASERQPRQKAGRPDALVRVRSPEGVESLLVVEAKSAVEPRSVPSVLEQIRRFAADGKPFVVAPFLSLRAREELAEAGAGYADATGNFRLALERPALFVETVGATSNPWPEERPLRSLKGPAAARTVRALCDFRPPYGIREIAERSGASPAVASRVVDLLDREALLTRETRGGVASVDWPRVIRRWTADYSFTGSNRTATLLEPRGLQSLLDKLSSSPLGYAVTGSIAASQVAPVAPARLGAIYVDDVGEAASVLELREAETGANVLLAEPLDPVAFERTREAGGITLAALSQVAADLLTSPGRGPAEAEELLRWMEQNEDSWRA